ncbi:MAG TPA: YihY/virulence factor BrkB family protein [Solirubrobacteraceae bacterium]|nr:YihY/virulence factor BrkB family protein [Solirubrobacteraceae bacterium]
MGASRSDPREQVPPATPVARGRLTGRAGAAIRRFWRHAWNANITGNAAMLAYNMLLAVIPVALLALFIGGQVLRSNAIQNSVLTDLREVFPGTAEHTLNSLLTEIKNSTTGTGVLALVASVWLGSSFWGALDTAFSHIYGCPARRWIDQKRFGIAMVLVVLLLMVATVLVPVVQSILRAGAEDLPFDLARIADLVYVLTLGLSVVLLFMCLALIYSSVPNRRIPWRAVWPGALAATVAIGVVSYAFPAYLSNISTIAQFGTTIVFVLIVLGWFYLLAVIILGGAVINAMRVSVPSS